MNTQNPTRSLRRRLAIALGAAFLLAGVVACSSSSGNGIAAAVVKPIKLTDLQSQFTARKPLTVDQCKSLAPDLDSLASDPKSVVTTGGDESYSSTEALCEIDGHVNLHVQVAPLTDDLQTEKVHKDANSARSSLRVDDRFYLSIEVFADTAKIDQAAPSLDAWLQKVADRIDTSGMAG